MYLITGCCGFIGMHLALKLLKQNKKVIGIDNLNNYYNKEIKRERLKKIKKFKNFKFMYGDLKNKSTYKKLKSYNNKVVFIIHFAGQAGVRYSIKNPQAYVDDNIKSYINLLENFKHSRKLKAIIYASSSSVYGNIKKNFSNRLNNRPISVYAATKLTMELLSNAYFHLYKLKCVGLRFFTVYGPYGRPDMAYFKFCKNIITNKMIKIYNRGNHHRSFTYIDDVIDNVMLVMANLRKINFNKNPVFNIGNPHSVSLLSFVSKLESLIGKKSRKVYISKQPGDVLKTSANINLEKRLFSFKFKISLEEGLKNFINWFRKYHEK